MHRHRRILYFLKNRELNELYVSMALRSFSIAMVGIFIPLYLLNLGYAFASVMLFYAAMYTTHVVSVVPAGKIACRFGFKHTILIGIPFLLVSYILMYMLPQYQIPIFIIAVIGGINNAFFWTGYHLDLSKFSDTKNRGKEIGIARIATTLFHVIGPVTGGLILTFMGFHELFIIVSLILICSGIPLLMSGDTHDPIGFSTRRVFRKNRLRDALTFVGYGVDFSMGYVMWPIFLFTVVFGEYTSIGAVFSLSLFFSLIFSFVVGNFSDVNRRLVLRIGGIMNSLVWLFRAFARTPLLVYITDSLYGMSQTIIQIPLDAINYDKANKEGIVGSIVFREIMINGSVAALFMILFFISDFFFDFLFAGGLSLLYLLF